MSITIDTPSAPPSKVLAEVTDYADAQRVVDRLSDAGFPVEHLRIIGTGIRSVEQITGRLTRARATGMGAAGGAWFGLLLGLLFGLFTVGNTWLAVLLGGVLIGAVGGAVFGFVSHWSLNEDRDFSSVSALQASTYAVEVDANFAMDASRITAGL